MYRSFSVPTAIFLLISLAPLSACEDGECKKGVQKADCAARVAEFNEWFGELLENGGGDSITGGRVHLATPAGQPYRANDTLGPLLGVANEEIIINDEVTRLGDETIDEKLKELFERGIMNQGADGDPPAKGRKIFALQLALHENLLWNKITLAIRSVFLAGFRKVAILYEVTPEKYPLPRPASSLNDELDRLHTKKHDARALIALLEKTLAGCPPAEKLVAGMAAGGGRVSNEAFGKDMAAALSECGCAPDIEALKAVVWSIFEQPEAALLIELAEPDVTGSVPVMMPGVVPWQAAFRKVQKAANLNKPILFGQVRRAISPPPGKHGKTKEKPEK